MEGPHGIGLGFKEWGQHDAGWSKEIPVNGSDSTQGNIRTLGERGSPLSKMIVVVAVVVVELFKSRKSLLLATVIGDPPKTRVPLTLFQKCLIFHCVRPNSGRCVSPLRDPIWHQKSPKSCTPPYCLNTQNLRNKHSHFHVFAQVLRNMHSFFHKIPNFLKNKPR